VTGARNFHGKCPLWESDFPYNVPFAERYQRPPSARDEFWALFVARPRSRNGSGPRVIPPREYLTEREVERLIKAAGHNRYGHRDATMILLAFRHGLRASELCSLRWEQVDLAHARLHVSRLKSGIPSASAFDLLELDGKDLRREPLERRKVLLMRLLAGASVGLQVNDHIAAAGDVVFRHACQLGFEGIVSKRLGSPYRSCRSRHWVKSKKSWSRSRAPTTSKPDACKVCAISPASLAGVLSEPA
jgi:integrase-like protein/ATP dependent DNA ligase-like protein